MPDGSDLPGTPGYWNHPCTLCFAGDKLGCPDIDCAGRREDARLTIDLSDLYPSPQWAHRLVLVFAGILAFALGTYAVYHILPPAFGVERQPALRAELVLCDSPTAVRRFLYAIHYGANPVEVALKVRRNNEGCQLHTVMYTEGVLVGHYRTATSTYGIVAINIVPPEGMPAMPPFFTFRESSPKAYSFAR